jgi:hypothetical protein
MYDVPSSQHHKYTWTSPDGKIHNQIDHILVDRQGHLNVLYVRSFRAADVILAWQNLGRD